MSTKLSEFDEPDNFTFDGRRCFYDTKQFDFAMKLEKHFDDIRQELSKLTKVPFL